MAVKRHAAQHPDDLDHLVADDFPEAPGEQLGADRPSYDELLARLDAMVGLAPIKTRVKEMVAKARFDAERRRRGLPVDPPTIHLVFAGNPGTGKTTVARLLGELYTSVGVLSRGHVVERSRAELVASYEGQTAPATKKAFEQAFGGILFVDEAYSLTRRGEHDPFGQEAVETLLKLMEDHRANAGVIVAGYTERMAEFLASNPGLASRFEQTIEFPDYSNEELVEIFARICADHQYEVSANVRRAAALFFAAQPRDATFGNGRLARSLFEAAETRHSAVLADGEADDADFTTLRPRTCSRRPEAPRRRPRPPCRRRLPRCLRSPPPAGRRRGGRRRGGRRRGGRRRGGRHFGGRRRGQARGGGPSHGGPRKVAACRVATRPTGAPSAPPGCRQSVPRPPPRCPAPP